MSENAYLPLFRKYRPQSFKDVIGQEFTVRALENAIKLNKIANAYLFCGPRGTGKTSSARIFAKSLNCEKGATIEPCQKCQSCLDVTNASGLDVIEIDAATNRGIDDAKELISKVQYAPMNGRYKIFIIDEVHMLSKEAFNALLKTFEEPPKNVIFILATTEPHKVIETIVSRCQRFDFRRITIDDIVVRLRKIADIEKINITDDALYSIAKNVSGGMRDSLALLDQASILGIEKQITKETIEELIGKLTFDVLFSLTEEILKGDIQSAISSVEKIYEKGSEPRNFVENFIEFLRNIVLILNSNDLKALSALTLFDEDNIKKIWGNSLFEKTRLVSILDKIIEFYKEIKVSTNPYLWAELMIISASSLTVTENVSNRTMASATVREPVVAPAPVAPAPATQPIPPVPIADENTNPVQTWTSILNKIESVPAKFFFSGVGKLIGISNGHITLGFVNQNVIAQAKGANKYNPLLKAISAVLGEGGSIEFVTITQDTKILETKFNVSSQEKTVQRTQTFENSRAYFEAPKNEAPTSSKTSVEENPFPEQDEKPEERIETNYSEVTKAMIETFGGRVIE